MSATSNNAEAGWGPPPAQAAPSELNSAHDGSRNALQALLAFACIHEQAACRRRQETGKPAGPLRQDEQFALDEVLQLVAERALSITGAEGVAIALAQDNAIVCRASAGKIVPDRGVRVDVTSAFSGACLRSGQTVRCDDSETDLRVNALTCRKLGARSMVAVPISTKLRVIGLIEAFSSEPFGFNESDVRSLNLLGELILAAVRPEEEDRLAELAQKIILAETPAGPEEPVEAALAAAPHTPARIIVDEKFLPPQTSPSHFEIKPAAPQTPVAETKPPVAEELPGPSLVLSAAPPERHTSVPGIVLIAALALIAIGLPWAVWPRLRHTDHINASTTPYAPGVKAGLNSPEVIPPPPAAIKPGALPQVTGVRHWSSGDSSTVVVDLEDQVQYEAHSLDNPARIYFDLHDTKLAAGIANQIIEINDAFLKRVRVAQPLHGVTRVVLETKNEVDLSVSLDPNPYRLTIQVHKPGAPAAPGVFSKPSPAIPVPKKQSSADAAPPEFQIVLDAGHGGWDLGAVGKRGLLEKDLVLDVVQRLGNLVESRLGASVIYTRQDDSYLSLEKRAEIANLAQADLFLSVHANYSDLATARGVETYYTNTYSSVRARTTDENPLLKQVNWTGVDIRAKVTGSHRFASDVQQALYSGLAARNPDIRNRGVKEEEYVVLMGTQMPAVLAEISFVSSPADEDQLQSGEYRQQIAEALYKGIAKYRNEVKRTGLAKATKTVQ